MDWSSLASLAAALIGAAVGWYVRHRTGRTAPVQAAPNPAAWRAIRIEELLAELAELESKPDKPGPPGSAARS